MPTPKYEGEANGIRWFTRSKTDLTRLYDNDVYCLELDWIGLTSATFIQYKLVRSLTRFADGDMNAHTKFTPHSEKYCMSHRDSPGLDAYVRIPFNLLSTIYEHGRVWHIFKQATPNQWKKFTANVDSVFELFDFISKTVNPIDRLKTLHEEFERAKYNPRNPLGKLEFIRRAEEDGIEYDDECEDCIGCNVKTTQKNSRDEAVCDDCEKTIAEVKSNEESGFGSGFEDCDPNNTGYRKCQDIGFTEDRHEWCSECIYLRRCKECEWHNALWCNKCENT